MRDPVMEPNSRALVLRASTRRTPNFEKQPCKVSTQSHTYNSFCRIPKFLELGIVDPYCEV